MPLRCLCGASGARPRSLLHLDRLIGRVDDAATLGRRVLLPEGLGELVRVRVRVRVRGRGRGRVGVRVRVRVRG